MNYWLLKSEPDVWSLEKQKNLELKEFHGTVLEIIRLRTT